MLQGKTIDDIRRAVREGRRRTITGSVVITDTLFSQGGDIIDVFDSPEEPDELSVYMTWSLIVPTTPTIHGPTFVGLWHFDEEI
jgi:hypothetical protein